MQDCSRNDFDLIVDLLIRYRIHCLIERNKQNPLVVEYLENRPIQFNEKLYKKVLFDIFQQTKPPTCFNSAISKERLKQTSELNYERINDNFELDINDVEKSLNELLGTKYKLNPSYKLCDNRYLDISITITKYPSKLEQLKNDPIMRRTILCLLFIILLSAYTHKANPIVAFFVSLVGSAMITHRVRDLKQPGIIEKWSLTPKATSVYSQNNEESENDNLMEPNGPRSYGAIAFNV